MAKTLLINPSYKRIYGTNQAGVANPVYPILSLSCLAASAKLAGHTVDILDLSYRTYDPEWLRNYIVNGGYDVIGVTATTPLANQMRDISFLVKSVSKDIVIVGGGAHPSALPVETMRESLLDYVAFGEADDTFVEILDGKSPEEISGICWRNGSDVVMNRPRPLIADLDELPVPAWELYPIDEYRGRITKIIARYSPITTIEFSRGCVFKCDFCGSKNTMGLGYRKKSPERCAEEMKYLEGLGYREVILADDIFTSDNGWAMQVCEEMIRRDVKLAWTCTNGIRVDSANAELFRAMRRAGCYRVHFGFESGNDDVLKAFGKGGKASLRQGIEAVNEAREAELDTWGMFMVGLSADTEHTMLDTINFARQVKVDVMKFGITVPFPGTPMFADLRRNGKIKTYDWDDYNVYNEVSAIFDHPRLSWDTIKHYYKQAYLKCYYLNPSYIWRRFVRSVRTFEFFWDVYFSIRFLFLLMNQERLAEEEKYAFKDEWRKLDIAPDDIRLYDTPKARASKSRKASRALVKQRPQHNPQSQRA